MTSPATITPPRHELVETFRNDGLDKVKVGGFDIDGVFRGKYISIDKLASALDDGFGFCDVVFGWDSSDALYDNVRVTGWHSGYPDLVAQIDADTFRRVPWEDNCPLFIVDFHLPGGEPFEIAPRNVLKRTVARAHQLGYEPVMSAEFEFWFFREDAASLRKKHYRELVPLSPGMFGYSILRASASSQLVDDIMRWMKAYDVEIEGLHTETGPGVFEAAIKYDTAVRAADKAALFKTGLKEIALRHGLAVTFMAKWNADLPGSSGHIHQSLRELRHPETNAFHDAADPARMSELFRHYLAGQIATLGDLMPMVAPTVNSYKRTVPGTWAPTTVTWSVDNRTAALRVIPGGPRGTRLEFRLAGADINPYLAFAACLAGGLYGVERALELPPPAEGNAYQAKQGLPHSLEEATDRFRRSAVARSSFGDAFVDHFAATRDWEVRAYQKAVTDWELSRYFEVI